MRLSTWLPWQRLQPPRSPTADMQSSKGIKKLGSGVCLTVKLLSFAWQSWRKANLPPSLLLLDLHCGGVSRPCCPEQGRQWTSMHVTSQAAVLGFATAANQ